jgi:RNA exonuclease 1
MMIEGYPMPLKGEYEEKYRDFRYSRTSYKPVTTKSPMFGLDCEMCRTIKAQNELARVSIVDESYQSVYETLVRPGEKILDYLTPWSGITKEMMENVTKTLEEVQEEVCNLLPPDAILVGQSLNCDLNAMKLMHPYVIDTSCIFNTTGDRNRKSKLQHFVKIHLDEDIQKSKEGHSSIEDSTYSLKLTKLKLSKDIYFGDVALQQKRNIIERQTYTGVVPNSDVPPPETQITTTLLSNAMKKRKKSAIVTTHRSDLELDKFYSKNQYDILRKSSEGEVDKNHGIKHHKEATAKDVIKKTQEILMNNDFNLSHFNIFEDDSAGEGLNEENVASLIPKVDKWISKLWNNVATNGLFVVIFGGHEKNTNGLSMVKIKN